MSQIRQIRFYQKAEHDKRFFLAIAPFRRVVREIAEELQYPGPDKSIRFAAPAMEALQVAYESFIVSLIVRGR